MNANISTRNVPAYLFTAVARQIKRKNREKWYSHAGDDDVHCVEEGFPPHRDVKRDVQVGLVAASVKFLVPVRGNDARDVAVNRRVDEEGSGRITAMK